MALNLETHDGSTWNTVNLVTEKIADFKLQIGYSHPAMLTFITHQAHQLTPIDPYTPIRFWDDDGVDPGSTAFSSSNPTFIGHVEEVNPGDDGQTIEYTCLDSTARASNQIPIMSVAWASASAEGSGAVPRLVFNSTIDNDDDWVFTRTFNADAGTIIQTVLDDALLPLRDVFAAPAASDAYVAADLTGMDFDAQEKVVFISEPIRSGIMRVLNDWEPEWRLLYYPGTRKWRFGDIGASAEVTYTLNDFTATNPILQLNLERSIEGRYTAVKIYGPEALENRDITTSGGGLNNTSTTLPLLDSFGAGGEVRGWDKWQIDDATKRRMGRLLPTAFLAPSGEWRFGDFAFIQQSMWTRTPTFLAQYKKTSAGTDAWETVTGWTFDPVNGIIDFKGLYVYRYNPAPAAGDPNYENPVNVRLVYPSYIDPLSTRIPTSGFEGTAKDDYDLENEMKIYDEMLAVGFLFGLPVTSATRLAKFDVLARNILNVKKDVIHMGGMVLEGQDYTFQLLDRRVNIDGVDGDGNAKTTGFETMKAIVTDVEYDYEDQMTTVQFSTDQAELTARDPEQIKAALKIGASHIIWIIRAGVIFTYRRQRTTSGLTFIGQSITVFGGITPLIFDPFLGIYDVPIFQT